MLIATSNLAYFWRFLYWNIDVCWSDETKILSHFHTFPQALNGYRNHYLIALVLFLDLITFVEGTNVIATSFMEF